MTTLYATQTFNTDGVETNFEINFQGGYIDKSHVYAYHTDALDVITAIPLTAANWVGPNTVQVTPALAAGSITIYRDTPKGSPLVLFNDGVPLSKANIDKAYKQALFASAEVNDTSVRSDTLNTATVLAVALTAQTTAENAVTAAEAAQAAAEAAETSAAGFLATFTSFVATLLGNTGSTLVGYLRSGVNTVKRLLSSILEDRVCVFDFMTEAEIADVRARTALVRVDQAIQRAVDYCKTYNRSCLYFPAGIYRLEAAVRHVPNLRIQGEGPWTRFVQYADTSGFVYNEAVDISLGRNLFINDCIISKNTVTATVCYGIEFIGTANNSWGTELRNLSVTGFYDGIRLVRPIVTQFSNVESYSNVRDGFSIVGDGTSVHMNQTWGRLNGRYGYSMVGTMAYVELSNPAADGNMSHGYFFGKDGAGLWPVVVVLNAPGAEGNLGDGFYFEDCENVTLNSPYSYANVNGFTLAGARQVVMNTPKALACTGWGVNAVTSGTPKVPATILLNGATLTGNTLGRVNGTQYVSEVLCDNGVVRYHRPLEGLQLLQNGVIVVQGNQDIVNVGVNSQVPHFMKFTVTFADFAAIAAMTGAYSYGVQVPNDTIIKTAYWYLNTEFSGGGTASCTMQLGDAGDTDRLITAVNVWTGAGVGFKSTTPASKGVGLYDAVEKSLEYLVTGGARTIQVRPTTTGANVNQLTQGSITIWLELMKLN